MTFFFDSYIKPFLGAYYAPRVLEIGASEGKHSRMLLTQSGIALTIVDPCLDQPLDQEFHSDPRITVHKGISLDVLPKLSGEFDAILIDGDHNWYTVLSELNLIQEKNLLAANGVVFFHDVGWPYGRRDMYYQPELIPIESRQPYVQMGIVQGQDELSPESDFNANHFNAKLEGGRKNGVLTAIEDFVDESDGVFTLFTVEEENGLGVMIRTADPEASEALEDLKRYREIELKKAARRERYPLLYKIAKALVRK